jgi:hypothetical protein
MKEWMNIGIRKGRTEGKNTIRKRHQATFPTGGR